MFVFGNEEGPGAPLLSGPVFGLLMLLAPGWKPDPHGCYQDCDDGQRPQCCSYCANERYRRKANKEQCYYRQDYPQKEVM